MASGDPGDKINKQDIFDLMFPVGSIYINVNNTNPSTFFGGTWVQIKDSFLLSAGNTYTGGDTGGAANASYTPAGTVDSHTLTTTEIPSHNHSLNSHTHGLNNHVHSLNSHTHGLNGHVHSLNGHTHSLNNHTHSLNGHTHSIPNHTHNYYYFSTQTQKVTNGQAANLISGSGGSSGALATSGWSGTTGGNSGSTGASSGNTGGNSGNTGGASGNTTAATGNTGAASGSTAAASGNTGNTGGGVGHNHGFTGTAATINTLPPYLVVYVWKRTE